MQLTSQNYLTSFGDPAEDSTAPHPPRDYAERRLPLVGSFKKKQNFCCSRPTYKSDTLPLRDYAAERRVPLGGALRKRDSHFFQNGYFSI